MNNKAFYQQLQKKLPHWQAQGWLDSTAAQQILDEEQALGAKNPGNKLSFILGLMGVLLLAAGLISFFAANWQGMSKLLKLSLLFSSMVGSYAIAARLLYQQNHPAVHSTLGSAFLLLGVLLFGNNIMLIAQMYHIDSHYPNGILLWTAGALITAWILRSETVLVLTLCLALLWSSMEIFDFAQIHWPWLIFYLINLSLIIRFHFHIAAHFSIVSLFIWLLFSLYPFSSYLSEGALFQSYLLVGLLMVVFSGILKQSRYWHFFADKLARYALIFSLIFLYILSFPELNLDTYKNTHINERLFLSTTVFTISALIFILLFIQMKQQKQLVQWHQKAGILGLMILLLTILSNIYYYKQISTVSVLLFNLLLFLSIIWLIVTGLHKHQSFYINLAFVVFSILLISRYFDTFWSLMNHSLFFILGGLMLISGGYWLEKKRRQLSEQALGDQ